MYPYFFPPHGHWNNIAISARNCASRGRNGPDGGNIGLEEESGGWREPEGARECCWSKGSHRVLHGTKRARGSRRAEGRWLGPKGPVCWSPLKAPLLYMIRIAHMSFE